MVHLVNTKSGRRWLAGLGVMALLGWIVGLPQSHDQPPGDPASAGRPQPADSWLGDHERGPNGQREVNVTADLSELALVENAPAEEDEAEAEIDPEHKLVYQLITEPLKRLYSRYPSFGYTGQMTAQLPTVNYGAQGRRDRFSGIIELDSHFSFHKDAGGNFYLRQRTNCSSTECIYSGKLYNSQVYFVDGQYHFYDLEGRPLDSQFISNWQARARRDNMEPLVRRNWLRAWKDLKPVAMFARPSGSPYKAQPAARVDSQTGSWRILNNYDYGTQMNTIGVSALTGAVTATAGPTPTLLTAHVQADIVYNMGYMKGARSQFDIQLALNLNEGRTIALPEDEAVE